MPTPNASKATHPVVAPFDHPQYLDAADRLAEIQRGRAAVAAAITEANELLNNRASLPTHAERRAAELLGNGPAVAELEAADLPKLYRELEAHDLAVSQAKAACEYVQAELSREASDAIKPELVTMARRQYETGRSLLAILDAEQERVSTLTDRGLILTGIQRCTLIPADELRARLHRFVLEARRDLGVDLDPEAGPVVRWPR